MGDFVSAFERVVDGIAFDVDEEDKKFVLDDLFVIDVVECDEK